MADARHSVAGLVALRGRRADCSFTPFTMPRKANELGIDSFGNWTPAQHVIDAGWDSAAIEVIANLGVCNVDAAKLSPEQQQALQAYCKEVVRARLEDIPPTPEGAEFDMHAALESLADKSLPMDSARAIQLLSQEIADLERDAISTENPAKLRERNARIRELRLRLAHHQAQLDGRN